MNSPSLLAAVLFSDPGTTYDAFALLVAEETGSYVVRDAWYGAFDEARLASGLATLSAACPDRHVFAVETIVGGVYGSGKKKRRARDLFATKAAEERLRLIAKQRGFTAHALSAGSAPPGSLCDVPASTVRTVLLGKPFPRNVDRQLAHVVPAWFTDARTGRVELPAVTSQSREHVYDAVAGAMVTLTWLLAEQGGPLHPEQAKVLRSRLSVPGGLLRFSAPRIWEGLVRIQIEEEAKGKARKMASSLGVKLPAKQRRPPRAVAKMGAEKRAETIAAKKRGPHS